LQGYYTFLFLIFQQTGNYHPGGAQFVGQILISEGYFLGSLPFVVLLQIIDEAFIYVFEAYFVQGSM
jgi:hypothetical protein